MHYLLGSRPHGWPQLGVLLFVTCHLHTNWSQGQRVLDVYSSRRSRPELSHSLHVMQQTMSLISAVASTRPPTDHGSVAIMLFDKAFY